jgi:hypothetical protein
MPGSDVISVTVSANTRQTKEFYLQALDNQAITVHLDSSDPSVLNSSNPLIAGVSPDTILLSNGETQFVDIKPGAADSARITVSGPPGSDTPASGREIVVTVQ